MNVARGPLMTPWRRWFVRVTAIVLWVSGGAWLWLHYLGRVAGEFGPEANPAESWMLRLHGAAAFASLWVFGLLWSLHITPGWSQNRRRLSGGALFAATAVLVITGYLLYYLGDENLRADASLIHSVLGVGALLVFVVHRTWKRGASDSK